MKEGLALADPSFIIYNLFLQKNRFILKCHIWPFITILLDIALLNSYKIGYPLESDKTNDKNCSK